MTAKDAQELTQNGLWARINDSIKDKILNACNEGEYEICAMRHELSNDDKERLIDLGYTVTYDGTDVFCPIYYISWKCKN